MLIQGNAAMIPLADESVHCIVTSPPYYGLRRYSGDQGKCPLGLENTPEEHVDRMVEICRELWRVLRPDGVLWWNYGDCYTHGNLTMMPHRVALALQADGWIVRQDLVWYKRNPMPESVRGWAFNAETGKLRKGSWRHTRAHEFVFMLTKKMQYFSNQEAVREIANTEGDSRFERTDNTQIFGRGGDESRKRTGNPTTSRNPRSVLDIPTQPYRGSHYATFPVNLIAPLIRAACPRWACPVCEQGWAPVVEKQYTNWADGNANAKRKGGSFPDDREALERRAELQSSVLGYRPTCEHEHTQDEAVPGIVFDPFMGSGTTGQVANFLGYRWIGVDLSRPYLVDQAARRVLEPIKGKALERISYLLRNNAPDSD